MNKQELNELEQIANAANEENWPIKTFGGRGGSNGKCIATFTPSTLLELIQLAKKGLNKIWFPILDAGFQVPWEFVEPHEPQALINHQQTLQTLKSRGGLCWSELYYVLEGKRWPTTSPILEEDAKRIVLNKLKEFNNEQDV